MITMNDTLDQSAGAFQDRLITYRRIARYYVAFLVVFGTIGNGTCLILYRRAALKRCRRVQYLTALAISDLVFLFCLGLMWLKAVGVEWQEMPGVCTASIYISNTACFLSGWYVMVLTAEMACVLRRPYHIVRTTAGSRLNVAKRIAVASLLGLLMNSWTLFLTESVPKPPRCVDNEEYYYYDDNTTNTTYSPDAVFDSSDAPGQSSGGYICKFHSLNANLYIAFTVIDMIVSFSTPLVVTLVLNVYIGCTITTAAQHRRFMSQHQILERLRARAQSGDEFDGSPISFWFTGRNGGKGSLGGHQILSKNDSGNSASSAMHRRPALRRRESGGRMLSEVASRLRRAVALRQRLRAEATVSSLLVAKSLSYLLLNLPNYAFRIWLILRPQQTAGTDASSECDHAPETRTVSEAEFLLQMIAYLTFYTQYALNFVIYSSNALVRNMCNRRSRASSIAIK